MQHVLLCLRSGPHDALLDGDMLVWMLLPEADLATSAQPVCLLLRLMLPLRPGKHQSQRHVLSAVLVQPLGCLPKMMHHHGRYNFVLAFGADQW